MRVPSELLRVGGQLTRTREVQESPGKGYSHGCEQERGRSARKASEEWWRLGGFLV